MYLWGESLGESCIYREKKRGIEKRNQGTVNGIKEKKVVKWHWNFVVFNLKILIWLTKTVLNNPGGQHRPKFEAHHNSINALTPQIR